MDRSHTNALTPEVIQAIERILEIDPNAESDMFDGLGEDFSTVKVLNGYFPDGALRRSSVCIIAYVEVEASLENLEQVRLQLTETQEQLQQEIATLQAELQKNQDPERMSVIQEMISVCPVFLYRVPGE